MRITKDQVEHVAKLARLSLDEPAVEKYAKQIDDVLGYVESLNQIDTSGIPATSHAVFLTNAFREDTEKIHLDREAGLQNAPEKEDGSFVVPRVIG
jgi:aspartyl-tRNA(Asn)/glutamyl-tRNA(Gln) amidotransferase subunit C